MKKLITLGVAAFAFMATFGVASAGFDWNNWGNNNHSNPSVTVTNKNEGSIKNSTNTSALTGKNSIHSSSSHMKKFNNWWGGGSGSGTGSAEITTGAAQATSTVQNQVGSNTTSIVGATGPVSVSSSNVGSIENYTDTTAATGLNHIHTSGGSAVITTGAAVSASDVLNVIGFNTTTIE